MLTRFEWDAAKAASNLRKHGVSFEIAMRVFADPFALTGPERVEHGEQRWQTLGVVDGYLVLLVAHTVHEVNENDLVVEVIRIISARAADRKERRRYEQENR
ncbi:BrnT family toxin [uncultured Castellaniella sp.]|uniref:BrnT family toxin n=1 Tax=uncultured Castellaniella sp. TaxID=647907 RepID=UPI0026255721|nr:BrnT family toxin [uncultured Castellaniella sp.]